MDELAECAPCAAGNVERKDAAHVVTEIAGLQFYGYGRWDEILERKQIPAAGDRLNLVRRPDHQRDRNAVEVWWGNGIMLGHLPRWIAAELAPHMDAGLGCHAAVHRPGDGMSAWSLKAILTGPAVAAAWPPSPVEIWDENEIPVL